MTRLMVQRVAVRRFAPGMSVEGAWGERAMWWEVVQKGRFACERVGGGGREGGKGEGGFVFCVRKGVRVEREREKEGEGEDEGEGGGPEKGDE